MFNVKTLGSALIALALIVPSFALAQSTTGLLTVYVQVINRDGFTAVPGNFTVSVSGQSPSPATFQGSLQGTLVTLNPGSYTVTVINQDVYAPQYSIGCDKTIAAGDTQTCVITLSPNANYQYGSSYGYNGFYPFYQTPKLSCHTDTPTVGLGQTARFVAQGGIGGTYNWYADGHNYPNIGPVLTATLEGTGVHSVTVTNAAQTATCTVNVVSGYAATYPNASYTYPTYATPGYTTYPTYQYPYSYPSLPNTGFEPISSAQMAFAVVLLMGAGIALYPYGRKAFALAVR